MSESSSLSVKSIAGKEIVFRELTVADVRAIAGDRSDFDVITDCLFEDMSLRDIPRMTSLNAGEIEEMLPSQIAQVIAACKERNPHFFKMLAQLKPVPAAG
jgi:hypothetical protein